MNDFRFPKIDPPPQDFSDPEVVQKWWHDFYASLWREVKKLHARLAKIA